MKYIIIVLLTSPLFSCKAQNVNVLNEQHYAVISAFINQNFDFDDYFYLDKYILQKKYSDRFKDNYNRIINFYKKADSICNNSKDTLQLEFFCPAAFHREKYVGLFNNENLKYLEETYNKDRTDSIVIDKNRISKPFPIILEHTDNYYKENETVKEGNWQNAGLSNVNVQFLTIGWPSNLINVNFPELHFGLPKILSNGEYITNNNARYEAQDIMTRAELLTNLYQSINPNSTIIQLKTYFLEKMQEFSAQKGGTVGTSAPLGWTGHLIPHQTYFISTTLECD